MSETSDKSASAKEFPIRTAEELSLLVGRSKPTLSRWMRRAEWNFGKPPWERNLLPRMMRWIADHIGASAEKITGTGMSGRPVDVEGRDLRLSKARQEIRKLSAAADDAETTRARNRGELLKAADVESEWASVGAKVRNAFQNLGSQLVPLALAHGMPHQHAAEFQNQIEQSVSGILRILSSDGRIQDNEDGAGEVLSGISAKRTVEPVGMG